MKTSAIEIFGVTDEFHDRCAAEFMDASDMITFYGRLQLISKTQGERDYAMYFFGRITEMNRRAELGALG